MSSLMCTDDYLVDDGKDAKKGQGASDGKKKDLARSAASRHARTSDENGKDGDSSPQGRSQTPSGVDPNVKSMLHGQKSGDKDRVCVDDSASTDVKKADAAVKADKKKPDPKKPDDVKAADGRKPGDAGKTPVKGAPKAPAGKAATSTTQHTAGGTAGSATGTTAGTQTSTPSPAPSMQSKVDALVNAGDLAGDSMSDYVEQHHDPKLGGLIKTHGSVGEELKGQEAGIRKKIPKPAHKSWWKGILPGYSDISGVAQEWKKGAFKNSSDTIGKVLHGLHIASAVAGSVANIAGKIGLIASVLGLVLIWVPGVGQVLLAAGEIANSVAMIAVGIDFILKMVSVAMEAVRIGREKDPIRRRQMALDMKNDVAIGLTQGVAMMINKFAKGGGKGAGAGAVTQAGKQEVKQVARQGAKSGIRGLGRRVVGGVKRGALKVGDLGTGGHFSDAFGAIRTASKDIAKGATKARAMGSLVKMGVAGENAVQRQLARGVVANTLKKNIGGVARGGAAGLKSMGHSVVAGAKGAISKVRTGIPKAVAAGQLAKIGIAGENEVQRMLARGVLGAQMHKVLNSKRLMEYLRSGTRLTASAYQKSVGLEEMGHGVAHGNAYQMAAGLAHWTPGRSHTAHRFRESMEKTEGTQWFMGAREKALEMRMHHSQQSIAGKVNAIATGVGKSGSPHRVGTKVAALIQSANIQMDMHMRGGSAAGAAAGIAGAAACLMPPSQPAPATPDQLNEIGRMRIRLATLSPRVEEDIKRAELRRQEALGVAHEAKGAVKSSAEIKGGADIQKQAVARDHADLIKGAAKAAGAKQAMAGHSAKLKGGGLKAQAHVQKGRGVSTRPDNSKIKAAEQKKAAELHEQWQKEYDEAGIFKKAKMKLSKWAGSIWGWVKKAGAWLWKNTIGPIVAKAKSLLAKALNFMTNIITYVMLRSLGGMSHSETMSVTFGKDIENKKGENQHAGKVIHGVHVQMVKAGADATEAEKKAVDEANRQAANIAEGKALQNQIKGEDRNLATIESGKRGELDAWEAANRPYFVQQGKAGSGLGTGKAASKTAADKVANPAAEPTVQPQAAAGLVLAAVEVNKQSKKAENEVYDAAYGAMKEVEKEEDGHAGEDVNAVHHEADSEKSHHGVDELPEHERKVVDSRIAGIRNNSALRRKNARRTLSGVEASHAKQQAAHQASMEVFSGQARSLAGRKLSVVKAAVERIEKGIQLGASQVDADRQGAYEAIKKGLSGTYGRSR